MKIFPSRKIQIGSIFQVIKVHTEPELRDGEFRWNVFQEYDDDKGFFPVEHGAEKVFLVQGKEKNSLVLLELSNGEVWSISLNFLFERNKYEYRLDGRNVKFLRQKGR